MNNKEHNKKDKKLKYHDSGLNRDLEIDRILYVPGMLPTTSNNQSSNIEIETYLLHPKNTFEKKNNITLDLDEENKNKEYRNFSIEGNKSRDNLEYSDYIKNGYKGQGRGYGDYEVNSKLRYGINSRLDDNNTRQTDISEIK